MPVSDTTLWFLFLSYQARPTQTHDILALSTFTIEKNFTGESHFKPTRDRNDDFKQELSPKRKKKLIDEIDTNGIMYLNRFYLMPPYHVVWFFVQCTEWMWAIELDKI